MLSKLLSCVVHARCNQIDGAVGTRDRESLKNPKFWYFASPVGRDLGQAGVHAELVDFAPPYAQKPKNLPSEVVAVGNPLPRASRHSM